MVHLFQTLDKGGDSHVDLGLGRIVVRVKKPEEGLEEGNIRTVVAAVSYIASSVIATLDGHLFG